MVSKIYKRGDKNKLGLVTANAFSLLMKSCLFSDI